jgi:hypothetical protein
VKKKLNTQLEFLPVTNAPIKLYLTCKYEVLNSKIMNNTKLSIQADRAKMYVKEVVDELILEVEKLENEKIEMAYKIDSLQSENKSLIDQIEDLQHELKEISNRND